MNTERRAELTQNYIDSILDNMSTKDMMRWLGDVLDENFSSYSTDQLLAEIGEQYPELLDRNDTFESSFATYSIVKVKVTSIDLDFSDDGVGDALTEEYMNAITSKIKETTFDLTIFRGDQVDEILVDTISNQFNWCVNSVQYEIVN
jgi:hypothetical protein